MGGVLLCLAVRTLDKLGRIQYTYDEPAESHSSASHTQSPTTETNNQQASWSHEDNDDDDDDDNREN